MNQWLLEFPVPAQLGSKERHDHLELIERTLADSPAEILDLQVAGDAERLFAVIDVEDTTRVTAALSDAAIDHTAPAQVRLVGATLDDVRATRRSSSWLVEWDLPEGLAMEDYLQRKKTSSPKYAEVPEVSFQRTWVREDMEKCLCFYDGPDEETVRCARDAVGAPVDRLYQLEPRP